MVQMKDRGGLAMALFHFEINGLNCAANPKKSSSSDPSSDPPRRHPAGLSPGFLGSVVLPGAAPFAGGAAGVLSLPAQGSSDRAGLR